jgi:uncharacterized protein (DUF983 family)
MEPQSRVIVDPNGRPARAAIDDRCPQCGEGADKRRPSGGFGTPWTVCACGFEWKDRVWRG